MAKSHLQNPKMYCEIHTNIHVFGILHNIYTHCSIAAVACVINLILFLENSNKFVAMHLLLIQFQAHRPSPPPPTPHKHTSKTQTFVLTFWIFSGCNAFLNKVHTCMYRYTRVYYIQTSVIDFKYPNHFQLLHSTIVTTTFTYNVCISHECRIKFVDRLFCVTQTNFWFSFYARHLYLRFKPSNAWVCGIALPPTSC